MSRTQILSMDRTWVVQFLGVGETPRKLNCYRRLWLGRTAKR
jgi:hypothetical protein